MKVLVIGRLYEATSFTEMYCNSPSVDTVYMILENFDEVDAGLHSLFNKKIHIQHINLFLDDSKNRILDLLRHHPVDLVACSSLMLNLRGFIDELRLLNIPYFGASKLMSELEHKKLHFRELMHSIGIPTPKIIHTDTALPMINFIKKLKPTDFPIVMKPEHNGRFKVDVYYNQKDMIDYIRNTSTNQLIFLEEYISNGTQIDIQYLCNGIDAFPMVSCIEDKKHIGNKDMDVFNGQEAGSLQPALEYTPTVKNKIQTEILDPLKKWLLTNGDRPVGMFDLQVILRGDDVYLIEHNSRPGSPDILNLWLNNDLVDLSLRCYHSDFEEQNLRTIHDNNKVMCMYTIIPTVDNVLFHTDDRGFMLSGVIDTCNYEFLPDGIQTIDNPDYTGVDKYTGIEDTCIIFGVVGDSFDLVRQEAEMFLKNLLPIGYLYYINLTGNLKS